MHDQPHRLRLPLPEGDAVYTFGADLMRAFRHQQDALGHRGPSKPTCRSVRTPLLDHIELPVELRSHIPLQLHVAGTPLRGQPIVALEPHADDAALSVSGTLLQLQRPLHIVTLFSCSWNLHPQLEAFCTPTSELISAIREAESKAAATLLGATHQCLNVPEATWPLAPPDLNRVDEIASRVAAVLATIPDYELIAPLCVSHHPDHILTRHVAERLGCRWYWEDVDFYVNYSRSVEDREYCSHRWSQPASPSAQSIDRVLFDKLAVLLVYHSQYFPSTALADVIRYNWAVARETRSSRSGDETACFVERTYRLDA